MPPFVSIILPVRNESKYIIPCLRSIAAQDYPKDLMELLIVDGISDDDTLEQIAEFDSGYDDFDIQVLTNTKMTAPHAMNLGISKARGDIIIRFDGHSVMEPDYVSNCVKYLEQTRADNVGGPMRAVGTGKMGKTIALAHASPFGLGGGAFHSDFEGYADTAYLGCFPKDTFAKYGLYDTRLTRNQDIELNARIRKGIKLELQNGFPNRSGMTSEPGKIYLTPKIKSYYYCRSTLGGLWSQNFKNGQWSIYTKYIAPYALSLRHFIPLIFVSSLILLSALSLSGLGASLWGRGAGTRLANLLHGVNGLGLKQPGILDLKAWSWHLLFLRLLALELFAYFSAMLLAVIQAGQAKFTVYNSKFENNTVPTENGPTVNCKLAPGSLLLLPLVFVTLHFSYGLGSLWGLATLPFRNK